MKHQNIFWGTLLVAIGLILLFDRIGIFDFNWWAFGKLWPFLLILWGIAIVPLKNYAKISLALIAAALSVMLYVHHASDEKYSDSDYEVTIENDNEKEEQDAEGHIFTELYHENISYAELQLDAVAGSFILNGEAGDLIYVRNNSRKAKFDFKVEELDSLATIIIKQRSASKWKKSNGSGLEFMLNKTPFWNFTFNIGAANFDFDFSPFKVQKIDVRGAAASAIQLKLGNLHPETIINLNAAASSIEISIPHQAGCRIEGFSVLSNRTLEGFEKLDKRIYQTPGFEQSKQKIFIKMDAIVSSFSIHKHD